MGIVVTVQVFRQSKPWERWWFVGCLTAAVAAITAAELVHDRTTRLVMASLFGLALVALIAPTMFQFVKVSKDAIVLIFQARTMLKDMRAGRWPPRNLDALTGRASTPPDPHQ
jgi:hypothetical protein